MRVLRVADVSGATVGGMNLFMRRSSAVLEQSGHEIDHVFTEELGAHRLTGGIRRLAAHWLVVREVLRRRRAGQTYDVVEIHEPVAFGYCLARRILHGGPLPPCVVISYGSEQRRWRAERTRDRVLGRRRSWKSRLLVPPTLALPARYALAHADHVLVPSGEDLRYLRDEVGVPSQRLTRVDSGVDDEWFKLGRTTSDGAIRVLFVGTWIDRKGAPDLAEAWRELVRLEPAVRLTATCTVLPEESVLSEFGDVAASVTAHPFASSEELGRDLASHDVFVLPSWFEGGIALGSLQAAAAGLASVVTAIGGNTDLFREADPEGDGAILVPPHDPGALAQALLRLARDPSLTRRLGEQARARARAFPWQETAARCLTAYEAAVRGRAEA